MKVYARYNLTFDNDVEQEEVYNQLTAQGINAECFGDSIEVFGDYASEDVTNSIINELKIKL